MKPSIVKILSATTLALFTSAEVFTAVSAVGYEKKVIVSSFSSLEQAIAIAGLRLAIECKTKLDDLSDQEITSKLQMLEVKRESLKDPLVSLLAMKGKGLVLEDCSGLDRDRFRSMIVNVTAKYDIRLSEDKENGNYLSEDQFYAAAEILAAHLCRKNKGLYSSANASKNQFRWAIANAGLTRSMMFNKNVLKAGSSLYLEMNNSCDDFKDSTKAENILLKNFNNQ